MTPDRRGHWGGGAVSNAGIFIELAGKHCVVYCNMPDICVVYWSVTDAIFHSEP